MDKKIVLVSGASSGIGEAVARKLAQAHHTVVLTGRDRKKLEGMERALASQGQRVVAIPGDVTKDEDVRHIVAEALKTFGAVHAFVHSAGLFRVSRLEETKAEEFRLVMDTNLTSLFTFLRHLLPHFYKQGGGHVVAVSSVAARKGFAGETAYCASKWGLMGFLEALRLEARDRGVKVTAILPGATLTKAWEGFEGRLRKEDMLSADTVAEAVLFALQQPPAASVDELVVVPARDPLGGAEKI